MSHDGCSTTAPSAPRLDWGWLIRQDKRILPRIVPRAGTGPEVSRTFLMGKKGQMHNRLEVNNRRVDASFYIALASPLRPLNTMDSFIIYVCTYTYTCTATRQLRVDVRTCPHLTMMDRGSKPRPALAKQAGLPPELCNTITQAEGFKSLLKIFFNLI